jgi:2-polyprenyl-3-methyl-5-hydroxy-6-metoxy-1,4-benzoquinol methylase
MNLQDRLHCPACKARLESAAPDGLRCTACGRTVAISGGIADFVGDMAPPASDPHRYGVHPSTGETPIGDLLARIRSAADMRWPEYHGDVLELGCGIGQMTEALISAEPMRGLLAVDTAIQNVHSCRDRLLDRDFPMETPLAFATLSGSHDAIRDCVADTVLGVDVMVRTGNLREFLAVVHRVLKPGGRAWFVVPNRRYRQALCQAMAEALVQSFARDRIWPAETHAAAGILARSRLLLVHQGSPAFLQTLEQKHLFDSEMLEDLAKEVGFATAEMLPLAPDSPGGETARHFYDAAGLPDTFARGMAQLVASAGRPFFSLLSRQDSSASMLLWLTKGAGPAVHVFSARPKSPPIGFTSAHTAVGGPGPRWSVELLARDTPAGIMVRVGGWCLANTDVQWVRLILDGVAAQAPVWRPRPDVHEILNVTGLYQPLNALCSGLEVDLVYDGVHAVDGWCPFRLEVVLANGLVLIGPAPEALAMDDPIVINQ